MLQVEGIEQLALVLIFISILAAGGARFCYRPRGRSWAWGNCGLFLLVFGIACAALLIAEGLSGHLEYLTFGLVFGGGALFIAVLFLYAGSKANQWKHEDDPPGIMDPNIQCLCLFLFIFAVVIFGQNFSTGGADVSADPIHLMLVSVSFLTFSLLLIAGFVWNPESHVWLGRYLKSSKIARYVAGIGLIVVSMSIALVSAIADANNTGWATTVVFTCLCWLVLEHYLGVFSHEGSNEFRNPESFERDI